MTVCDSIDIVMTNNVSKKRYVNMELTFDLFPSISVFLQNEKMCDTFVDVCVLALTTLRYSS